MLPFKNTDRYPNIRRGSAPASPSVARAKALTVAAVGFVNAGIFLGVFPAAGFVGLRAGMTEGYRSETCGRIADNRSE